MARRVQVRVALLQSLDEGGDDQSFAGIGTEDWRFDHPLEFVRRGWSLYRASQYQRMPSYEEIASMDESWVSDILLMDKLYHWRNAKTPT